MLSLAYGHEPLHDMETASGSVTIYREYSVCPLKHWVCNGVVPNQYYGCSTPVTHDLESLHYTDVKSRVYLYVKATTFCITKRTD